MDLQGNTDSERKYWIFSLVCGFSLSMCPCSDQCLSVCVSVCVVYTRSYTCVYGRSQCCLSLFFLGCSSSYYLRQSFSELGVLLFNYTASELLSFLPYAALGLQMHADMHGFSLGSELRSFWYKAFLWPSHVPMPRGEICVCVCVLGWI